MKNNYFNPLRFLWTAVLGLFFVTAQAQLEQGNVYRFDNVGYAGYSLAATSTKAATAQTTNADAKSQMWYVSDTKTENGVTSYRLRNVGNGYYLQGNGASTAWAFVDGSVSENVYLYLLNVTSEDNTYYTLSVTNSNSGQNKMHCDAGKNIVGWSFTDNNHTQWTITEVEMTSDELNKNWNDLENVNWTEDRINTVQGYLDALFTDNACTELKDTYAGMSLKTLQEDDNYTALPVTLQNMVTKVWNEQTSTQTLATAWGEAHYNGSEDLAWDGEYAKRFRVQLYEPYSERDCTNAGLHINPHTNLNNPTGIIGKERDALYVMVGGDIKEGASLYLGAYSGHGQGGAYNDGVELHKGLNVVPIWADKQWTCIYYTVPTLQNYTTGENIAGSNKRYDITKFPDLKIHIEGGYVNGYYNAVGDDLWAHNAATTGCDDERNLSSIATTLKKADGTTTPTNDNLLQTNNVYPKGDNEADWDYIAARNVLDDLTILGRYMVFQFCFNSPEESNLQYSTNYWFTKDGTRRVNICDWLERWDRIMMSERLMMGLLSEQEVTEANARYHAWNAAFGSIPANHDIFRYTGNETENPYACNYSKYYRMHGLGITMDNGYMSGGWNSSNYQYKTLADIIGKMTDESSTGGVCWGPAHEIGHQHQGPLNMRGLTEVSNNFFSNVAVWYDGRGTSRTAEGQGDLSNVLNAYSQDGNDFYTNNIWAQTQMYYKLWLYYHLVGHNTAFAPTLIEMLRQDPMTIEYNQAGATSLLHFYKKVCDAAQEDLTDFFRAYGFLEVMDHRYVGDYSSAEYTQTQEDIDAAIAYVKAKNYRANVEILFINDYTTDENYVRHDGTTERLLWDGNTYSDLGSFQAYESGSTANGTYTMTAANGQVTMSGATGGVGFVIRDAEGNLLAFSSDYTFPVNDATMAAIGTGTAVLQSVAANGSITEITYDGSSAAISLLSGLLTTVKNILDGDTDNGGDDGKSYTKPGLYKANNAHYTALASKYTEAEEIYVNGNVAQYMAAYSALKDCYDALLADEYATVALQPGNKYTIRCKGRDQTYMYLNSETSGETTTYKVACTTTLPASTNYNAFLWSVEETGTAGKYYLKNASGENLYVLTVSAESNEQFQCGSAKYAFGIQQVATGSNYFTLYHSNPSTYMNAAGNNGNVVSWNSANDNNSQWAFTLVEADATAKARILLEEMESNTRTLLESMATMGVKGPLDMSTFRITSNSVEQGHGTELLVDGDASTYFHSNWSTSSASSNLNEDHYLQIDCGEGNDLEQFQFNYITLPRDAGNLDAPASIYVYGGNTVDGDGNVTDLTYITKLSKDDTENPLPCISRAQSYTSPVIGTAGSSYRYIRLTVKNATKDNAVANGTLNGHHWFGLAELGLSRASSKLYASDSRYTTMTDAQYVTAADALGDAAVCLANADATETELTAAYNALSAQYTILLNAYNAAENADLTAAQNALQGVIDQTQSLLNECGSISKSESVALQCTDANGAYYISSNADQNAGGGNNDGGGVAALLDTNLSTYFHSRWGGTVVNEDHYLQVDMGSLDALTDFTFGYTVRQNDSPSNNSPHPTIIEVYGSNDGTDFSTLLGTFKRTDAINPLPAYTESGASWTSTKIQSATPYRYVRFVVTKSAGPGNTIYGGHYFFAMGTFSLTKIETKVTLSENCGSATEQDLLDTDDALQSAIAAKSIATTVNQLTAAQTALQAQYEALLAAKNRVSTADLETAVASLRSLYESCFSNDECTMIKDEYNGSINLTQPLLEEVNTAIMNAQAVIDASQPTEEEVIEQQAAVEAMQERLETAIYATLPVKLSTDEEKVYYSISIKRDGTPVLEYGGVNGEDNKLKVASSGFEYGNDLQAFYFTKGTTAPQVFIHTKSNDYILTARIVSSTSDLAEGAGKVAGVDPATDESTLSSKEWIIEANTSNDYSGWYNIRPIPLDGSTTDLYMSNFGGVGNNIGFYTVADDGGSCFRFTICDKGEAFYRLYDYYTHSVKVNEIIESQYMSDDPGYYSSDKANEYNSAYFTAGFAINSVLNGSTSFTDEDFTNAYNTLVNANEALTPNLPEAGKYYVLRSACTQANYCKKALAYVDPANATQRIYWSKGKAETDATAIWTITPNGDETFAVRNLHTGTAVSKFNERLTDAAGNVTLTFLDYKTGELKLNANGTIMHAQQTDNIIVNWPADKGSASAWNIVEVTDLSAVSYVLNMSQYGYAGFYSAYPVQIPAGLQAYYVKQDDVTTGTAENPGTAHLTEITDVIPANTGVILYGAQGTYALKYDADGGTEVSDNMLAGSPYLCYKQGEEGTKYYLFGVKNENVGLYVAWLEYNADGSQTISDEDINDTDRGGYFRVGANKIYLPYTTTVQGVSAFHLDFNTGVETSIDPLELLPRNAVIYNLQGRRIHHILHSGVYIVNGVKRYVRTRNVQP